MRTIFEEKVYANWAGHFGLDVSVLHQPGMIMLQADDANSREVELFFNRDFSIIRGPQDDVAVVKTAIQGLDIAHNGYQPEAWHAVLSEIPGATWEVALLHHLYPDDLSLCTPAAPYTIRQIGSEDAAAMETLHADCSSGEVSEADVGVDHHLAYGCFLQDNLVAAASVFEMAGFMDIGVLTSPHHRRKGLGRAVVGALCQHLIENNALLLYRCAEANQGSHYLGTSLGFKHYFWQVCVEFNM